MREATLGLLPHLNFINCIKLVFDMLIEYRLLF